jgi:catechol 2,3-dioxygenase-like lactoylglutathione lyase family enzyme
MIPIRPALTRLDHVQLSMPKGGEDDARAFYSLLLGLREIEKPATLKAQGGCWFTNGYVNIHLGADPDFLPARRAHPAFRTSAIDKLAADLHGAGYPIKWNRALSSQQRFHTHDPFGNRLEFVAETDMPI